MVFKIKKLPFLSNRFYFLFLSIISLASCASDIQAPTENNQHLHYSKEGVFKLVKADIGQTISQIAEDHNVNAADVSKVNSLKHDADLKQAQIIKIPVKNKTYNMDPKYEYEEEEPAKSNEDEKQLRIENEKIKLKEEKPSLKEKSVSNTKTSMFKSSTPLDSKNFMWPIHGKIIERYGKHQGKFNEGINIAAPINSPVKASSDGEVIYVGNQMKAYGNLIIIKHARDYMTAYAHNNNVMVKKGEHVKKGQVIANVGKSGNVKVPQLHFSIRKGKKTIDPESKG